MMNLQEKLFADIEKIRQIPIVPTMLDVVCQTTGMGFAAIARVTSDRWIACSVRDDIQFGLKPGGELKVETTICNEIRESRKAVIIDHVDKSEEYCNHHTPRMYGIQSYISIPIILQNGEFFGTLCAIDPRPAQLNNPKTIGMFNLFAELISFHLNNIELIERSNNAIQELSRQLTASIDENRQYRHISNHNLQEPLRKLRLFSNLLTEASETGDMNKVKGIAAKINSSAQRFSMMIKDLSEFSDLNLESETFEMTDLNKIIGDVCMQLQAQMDAKNAVVNTEELPVIQAIPLQMEQLFYHLISNAVKFSKKEEAPVIRIYSTELSQGLSGHRLTEDEEIKYVEIRLEDNGIGIDKSQLENVFDIFSQLPYEKALQGGGIGLAYCRKVIRNHGGIITAQSEPGKGTTFSIILPVTGKQAINLSADHFIIR
jgi:signal transduction histidine kinase